MSRAYSGTGSQTPAANDSLWSIQSATTVRPRVHEMIIGAPGTPEDKASLFIVDRFDTADGTATSVTPSPLDSIDPASLCTFGSNHTTEPTYTTKVQLNIPLNSRNTFRWVVGPGKEIRLPAVATEGIGLFFSTTSSTIDHFSTVHWIE